MNVCVAALLLLLLPTGLCAQTAEEHVQSLIAEAWLPREVRVEWKFSGKVPAEFDSSSDWKLVQPRPLRIAGNIILSCERKAGGTTRKIIANGTARIFGTCLTVKKAVASGEPVELTNLDESEGEWTYLNGDAAQMSDFSTGKVAARALVPGRPLSVRDIRGAKLIHRGQTVDVQYADGGVHIRLSGRALKDGAAGDVIPVATEMVAARQVSGTVKQDGTIQLVR